MWALTDRNPIEGCPRDTIGLHLDRDALHSDPTGDGDASFLWPSPSPIPRERALVGLLLGGSRFRVDACATGVDRKKMSDKNSFFLPSAIYIHSITVASMVKLNWLK